MAVAAFFITKGNGERYTNDMPGEEEQAEDTIFESYKKMAQDQEWLQDIGMGHKTWTFGYGHMKSVAEEAGCQGVGTRAWDHVCVIVWKTSPDGSHMQTAASTHFGLDFSKADFAPTAEDVRKYIHEHATAAVQTKGA